MKMNMKSLLALLLVVVMMVSVFAGCSKPAEETKPTAAPTEAPTEGTEPAADAYVGPDWAAIDAMDYEDASDALYDWNLGEFAESYAKAKEEMDNVDLRLALMAQAEAKMLESGVFMPIYGDGGSYAMTRVVPRSATTTSWGLDEYRWYGVMVTNELIKSADRTALVELWAQSADAAAWDAASKAYLEEHGYTLGDTYNVHTSYDMETWDVIATSMTSDSYFLACTYTPLLEYDAKNVAQPALAESYEVSDDGLTYTFHLRKGVKWVDQQGREIAEVTANDFVTSMMHLIDNSDELGYLMTSTDGCGIKNFDAYLTGDVTDFSEVGVKAVDDYTLVYTLEKKFPAFTTMLGYGCFAPLNYEFYKAQGGTFSAEGDEYTAGNYGKGPSSIAYCGALLCTNYTEQNIWTYQANPAYWNPDAINVHTVNFYYNDGSDTLRTYNEAKVGETASACGFNASALELAKTEIPEGETESYFDLYHYTTQNSATTYCAWLNINRAAFADFNDATSGISPKADNEAEQQRTRAAMNNQHFRLALAYGFDRGAYNAVDVGEDLKYASLKNSYVDGTFSFVKSDVTVDVNGESVTYPAGTFYGKIMQDQLDADGFPIKAWDPAADDGAGSGSGYDGWYNVDNARAELQKAIDELAQVGVEISAENPIQIDTFYFAGSETNTKTKQAYKQVIEASLEGKVVVNLIEYQDAKQMQYAYYRNATGAEANFDISHSSGWGPDYGDPQTFLDTIQSWGYMCKNLGIY